MQKVYVHTHVGSGVNIWMEPDDFLRLTDNAGLNAAVVCPMDRLIAVDNRAGNDYIIQTVRAHPDRLAGMAVANPWYGDRAADEPRRALDAGLAGLKMHPVLQGFRLGDLLVDPLLAIAEKYQVPVYAHPGTAGNHHRVPPAHTRLARAGRPQGHDPGRQRAEICRANQD